MTAPDIAERYGPGGWKFGPEVAEVFDDHVRASVPFYDAIQGLIAECCDWLAPSGSLIADLGCSTGNTAAAILARHPGRALRFALYDESVEMLARARPAVEAATGPGRVVSFPGKLPGDGLQHDGAALTLAVFVLQFMPWDDRAALLADARARSADDGALIVAEKIAVRRPPLGRDRRRRLARLQGRRRDLRLRYPRQGPRAARRTPPGDARRHRRPRPGRRVDLARDPVPLAPVDRPGRLRRLGRWPLARPAADHRRHAGPLNMPVDLAVPGESEPPAAVRAPSAWPLERHQPALPPIGGLPGARREPPSPYAGQASTTLPARPGRTADRRAH